MSFSLETESSKFWSVNYTKMRKKIASIFFKNVTYYSIFCCKNYNFNSLNDVLPSYRNQSTELSSKSIDLFLNEDNSGI